MDRQKALLDKWTKDYREQLKIHYKGKDSMKNIEQVIKDLNDKDKYHLDLYYKAKDLTTVAKQVEKKAKKEVDDAMDVLRKMRFAHN